LLNRAKHLLDSANVGEPEEAQDARCTGGGRRRSNLRPNALPLSQPAELSVLIPLPFAWRSAL
jgi:hypothetical protein